MALVLQHWAWEKWPPKQNNQDDILYLDTIFSTIWKKRGSYGLFKSNLATLKLDAPDADSLLHSFRIPPNMWLPLWLPLCHLISLNIKHPLSSVWGLTHSSISSHKPRPDRPAAGWEADSFAGRSLQLRSRDPSAVFQRWWKRASRVGQSSKSILGMFFPKSMWSTKHPKKWKNT